MMLNKKVVYTVAAICLIIVVTAGIFKQWWIMTTLVVLALGIYGVLNITTKNTKKNGLYLFGTLAALLTTLTFVTSGVYAAGPAIAGIVGVISMQVGLDMNKAPSVSVDGTSLALIKRNRQYTLNKTGHEWAPYVGVNQHGTQHIIYAGKCDSEDKLTLEKILNSKTWNEYQTTLTRLKKSNPMLHGIYIVEETKTKFGPYEKNGTLICTPATLNKALTYKI